MNKLSDVTLFCLALLCLSSAGVVTSLVMEGEQFVLAMSSGAAFGSSLALTLFTMYFDLRK